MAAEIIDGAALAEKKRGALKLEIESLRGLGRVPGLAVVMVGDNPASATYVRNKRRACMELGIHAPAYDLPAETTEMSLLALISELNESPEIDGILVQLPLPKHIRSEVIICAIDPEKDVDGFHPVSLGRLFGGHPGFIPCTAAGIMDLIHSTGVSVEGKKAVVVGRSNIVGKPTAMLLLQENATVTICHSRTKNLAQECQSADILVVAIGKRAFVPGDWIKPGALVVDVGTNREEGKLYGDVEFESARLRAAFITPVPKGVGPMTIAWLMANTVQAAKLRALSES